MSVYRLPDPPAGIDPEVARWIRSLIRVLELYMSEQLPKVKGWGPSNTPTSSFSTYRGFDAGAADLDTTRKALAILVDDLKKQGILSKDV